jgi:hypothetical protein
MWRETNHSDDIILSKCSFHLLPNASSEPRRAVEIDWKADVISPLALLTCSPSVFHSKDARILVN